MPLNPGRSEIAAGVVTYEPEIDLLANSLTAVAPQVNRVFVFDNGSTNISKIKELITRLPDVVLVSHPTNDGIAYALNQLASLARTDGYSWLLTLDQDSIAADGMVAKLQQSAESNSGMVTPYILDRNKVTLDDYIQLNLPPVQYYVAAARKGAITSGALMRLSVLEEVGGFDAKFFIDYVDYDLNRRIMDRGYRISRVNSTYLSHEVGKARKTWLVVPRRTLTGGWNLEPFFSFGHSPIRCFYKARNRVLYTKKHWRKTLFRNEGINQIPQQLFLIIAFEDNRWVKAGWFVRGVWDGIVTPLR